MLATPQQLIILPAEVELEVINQPENGLFCSDLLSLTPELLADFKHRYMSEVQTGRLTSLCAPLAPEMSFMWQSVLRAVREGLSAELQHHQAMGLLLALYQAGYAGPLLNERREDITGQVRQIIMPSPAEAWSVAKVAKMLFLGESTLRRRLQQESRSFRRSWKRSVWPTRWGNYSLRRDPLATLRKAAATCQARALAPVFVSTMDYYLSMYADGICYPLY